MNKLLSIVIPIYKVEDYFVIWKTISMSVMEGDRP